MSSFQEVVRHIFFHPAVIAANNATAFVLPGDGPIVAFEYRSSRHPATAEKCGLGQSQQFFISQAGFLSYSSIPLRYRAIRLVAHLIISSFTITKYIYLANIINQINIEAKDISCPIYSCFASNPDHAFVQ